MTSRQKFSFRQSWKPLLILLLVALYLFAYLKPWPYVISGPGSAEPIHSRVETGHKLDEKGQFLFTTVSSRSKPNLFSLLYAKLSPRLDIQSEQTATGGRTNMDAYRNLLAWMRDSSENNAMLAAYRTMNKTIKVEEQGVIVVSFLPGSKARESGLQEGDIITRIDDKETLNFESFYNYISGKKPGDKVKVSGKRGDDKTFEATIPLMKLDDGRTGIGFQRDLVLKVTPPDPVKFDFNDIGGPSAGLMMTLEIIAQLTDEDLTKGYKIAGTGTIAADGSVGQIGGINYKLMAADSEHADYFLVPNSGDFSNWKLAEETVAKLKLSPKLVKVATLADAVKFLKSLPANPNPDQHKK
ncbi:SepM family pheromone-processing serine protease [Cohnella yongneupensis]|uniref:endopeptidase La n=1 Tax=Cohnella yongneupensis TaxID=425006 RepID=A0ABW0QZZ6_9BACL